MGGGMRREMHARTLTEALDAEQGLERHLADHAHGGDASFIQLGNV